MPPRLRALLAALAVEASTGEFAAVERLVGGSFSGLSGAGRNPAARIDAADLTSGEVRDCLSGQPIGQQSEVRVAWIVDRLGARMSFGTFAANIDDLWFPALDDIVCVLHADGNRMVLVLDHEEVITLSSLNYSGNTGAQRLFADQRRADSSAARPRAHVPSRTT